MVKDFREYLVESSRHETFGRVFKELGFGDNFFISFQASDTHGSEPCETLDDVYAYTRWEVSLRANKPAIDVPNAGAWDFLKNNYWAKPFDKPEFQRAMVADCVPVKHCQQILQDATEMAVIKGYIKSEDEIRIVEADEEIKRTKVVGGGCGGCGGGKK